MANLPPTPFGMLLKRYRVAALLTQEQLAARAQLSPDTIRALERGKRRMPRPNSVQLLADALSLTGEERAALLAAAQPPIPPAHVSDQPAERQPAQPLMARQPNRFLGRASELETILRRLTESGGASGEQARLLTLTGPAGVGKTRLALTAAAQMTDRFADGVVVVDLTPIRDPLLMLPTIALTLGLADIGSRPLIERIHDYLRERSMLLVLDNFEQVLPAANALADMLANCPGLSLLVTSRIPLRLRWEWSLRVGPLPVPAVDAPLPPLDMLIEIPSIALFMERARARRADFVLTATQAPLVAQLVSELDGLPLALELAAARLDVFSLSTLVRRLSDRLRLLRWEAADLPERQRSLETAVGWSYDLLSESEQQFFRCLGVFSGQVALPAITAVIAAESPLEANEGRALEGMASLAEKSLVLTTWPREHNAEDHGAKGEEDQEPAFTMLETVREYAWERLERQGVLEAACRAHAYYFLSLAEQADPHLRGPNQFPWYFRLEREHNNLRAALRWLMSREGPAARIEREAGLRLATALGWFWWTRGYIVEGPRWLSEALDRAPDADPVVRAQALCRAGAMLAYQGASVQAKTLLEEALTLARQNQNPAWIAQAISYLGLCAVYAGDIAASIPLLHEALRRGQALGEPHPVAMTLMFLGASAFAQGDDDQAVSVYSNSLTHFETAGDMLFSVNVQLNLGWLAWRRGDLSSAVSHTRTGIEASVISDNRRLLSFGAQTTLTLLSAVTGLDANADFTRHARLLGAIDALNQATGMTLMQTVVKDSMAALRKQIQRAGLEVVYREGRSLPFGSIATLALTLLDEIAGILEQSTSDIDKAPRGSR
jgi:predicted ATPase/transcriptional regulator with XRE-family HTH domain